MDSIRVSGGRRLKGEIPISGAKNAALPLMVACLLTDAPLTLTNVPDLADVAFMAELLKNLGVAIDWRKGTHVGERGRMVLDAGAAPSTFAPYDIVRKMRASFLVLGPLVARMREAKVSLPGGCAIGARPVDLHLKGLEAMGAEIALDEGYVRARAPFGLSGGTFAFPFVSVGGTENLLMAAALAQGETVLDNAAQEPEIVDLGHCLIAMGARISGLGTPRIVIEGVNELHEAMHAVLPDRIETGTYAIAACIAGGEVELTNTRGDLIAALTERLRHVGAEISETNRGLVVARNGARPMAQDVATAPFPGFPTDLQAQYMALMATADGTSRIKETIFENRFMHVPELARMGADIKVEGDTATVTGVEKLKGAPVMATDLRASVSLVLAGLAAEGETIVNRVYHLDRGFEHIEEKLSHVGADVERLKQ
jgi:UDP-N-acetylglucosamine 1-carboxyvinyltransferase